MSKKDLLDEHERKGKALVFEAIKTKAYKKRHLILFVDMLWVDENTPLLIANDLRNGRRWIKLESTADAREATEKALLQLQAESKKPIVVVPIRNMVRTIRRIDSGYNTFRLSNDIHLALEIYSHSPDDIAHTASRRNIFTTPKNQLSHLDQLEAESLHIIREVMAEADNPVMLYSVGKDSSVMLHLARKAFYPSPPPFPLLHIDTCWKFQAMYDFRNYMARKSGMELLVHINPEGRAKNINPFDHGSSLHTDIMKTQSLKMALDRYKFDIAFGGARRDEEKSRAKERVFSFRTSSHRWEPKNQRPELWNLYNGKKKPNETIRVFPISNWTELDVWQYIYRERIPIVPLYFAARRPVISRNGMLIMVDDNRLTLDADESIEFKKIRFRTLGCYPLTGAIESDADDLTSIILELLSARTSERQGRAIDTDSDASMEKKKQVGYF